MKAQFTQNVRFLTKLQCRLLTRAPVFCDLLHSNAREVNKVLFVLLTAFKKMCLKNSAAMCLFRNAVPVPLDLCANEISSPALHSRTIAFEKD